MNSSAVAPVAVCLHQKGLSSRGATAVTASNRFLGNYPHTNLLMWDLCKNVLAPVAPVACLVRGYFSVDGKTDLQQQTRYDPGQSVTSRAREHQPHPQPICQTKNGDEQ